MLMLGEFVQLWMWGQGKNIEHSRPLEKVAQILPPFIRWMKGSWVRDMCLWQLLKMTKYEKRTSLSFCKMPSVTVLLSAASCWARARSEFLEKWSITSEPYNHKHVFKDRKFITKRESEICTISRSWKDKQSLNDSLPPKHSNAWKVKTKDPNQPYSRSSSDFPFTAHSFILPAQHLSVFPWHCRNCLPVRASPSLPQNWFWSILGTPLSLVSPQYPHWDKHTITPYRPLWKSSHNSQQFHLGIAQIKPTLPAANLCPIIQKDIP